MTACPNLHEAGRKKLPDRRPAETLTFEHNGASFTMTAGRYDDGRIGEIFMNAAHANSALDFVMSDGAILLSIALQYGAPLDEIRRALKLTTSGEAASPLGKALDLIQ
jgi:hypothetical protein